MIAWLKSSWRYTCPRCRQGQLFIEPFVLKKPLAMNETCSNCNLDFEPEPGFYFGAMFVSYIITSFLFLAVALFLVFKEGWSADGAMGIVLLIGAIIYLKILRLSRSLYIHMLVKFRP